MQKKRIISGIVLAITTMMVFSAITVMAAPPQPFERYGQATVDTVAPADGVEISAWVDGVRYATNLTYAGDGTFVIVTPGNDDVITTEKDGADAGENIVYWINDPTNGLLIANENDTWVTNGSVNAGLTFSSTGQPYLAKIWELVPSPASGNDFLWIAAPSTWDPTDYYLEDNDGWSLPLAGNAQYVSNTAGTWSAWYVDLGATTVLDPADEMKLVWTDPAATKAGGNPVVIDRVEYGNQTVEPDNTIMPDAASPGADQGIIRLGTVSSPQDTENCTADFTVVTADYPILWTPQPVYNLWVEKDTVNGDAILHWDDANNPPGGYNIYESNNSLAPWPWTLLASGVTGTTYTHVGALADADNHFYIVRATDGTTEGNNSSMAFVVKFQLENVAAGVVNWVSIPDEVFALARDLNGDGQLTASDLVIDIEGGTGAGTNTKISAIRSWDATTQAQGASYYYAAGFVNAWTGTDFTITQGMAVKIETTSAFTWVINGTDNGTANYSLENVAAGVVNWISIPFTLKDMNADGAITASDIVIQIEGGTGAGTNTKISAIRSWDATTQAQGASYYYAAGFVNAWTGTDFTITQGMAVKIETTSAFTWTPVIIQTVVTQ